MIYENVNKDMMKTNKKIQVAVNKLISEEYLAGQLYFLFIRNLKCESETICKSMIENLNDISHDELSDHFDNLIKEARFYGFEVPTTIQDFTKFAGEGDVKAFQNMKKCQSLDFYIKESIASETRAIQSYGEVLQNTEGLNQYPQLFSVLINNYHDEIDHLDRFKFLGYIQNQSV